MKSFNEKGFTLIELLIVIGIIAILAAAVIVAINPGQQFAQARNASRQSHLSSISTAIYSHYVTEGGWPACIDEEDEEGEQEWVDLHNAADPGCEEEDQLGAYLSGGTLPETVADDDTYEVRILEDGDQIELRVNEDNDEWDEDMNIIQ